jgi:nicotinate-nucleotide adenylyltransferase
MKTGLFFGSFNPIHHGHLIIANFVLQNTDISQIWFVVSPQNPFKESRNLLNEYHRLALVKIAIEGEKNMRAIDIEFKLPRPSYTIDTLTYLKEKFPNQEFCIIVGSDSIQNMHNWKNGEKILKEFQIYVYRRSTKQLTTINLPNITFLDSPIIEISSTQIRSLIKERKSIRWLVPEIVMEEIEKGGYYK